MMVDRFDPTGGTCGYENRGKWSDVTDILGDLSHKSISANLTVGFLVHGWKWQDKHDVR